MKDIALLCLTLILAALGILLASATVYGVVLLVLAACLAVLMAVWFAHDRWPRVHETRADAYAAAAKIYERAAEQGGELLTTHVFPRHLADVDDLAVEKLASANPRVRLDFTRVMILENRDSERQWITDLFERIPGSVRTTLSVLTRYPLHLPRLVHTVLPRANLMLYRKGLYHVSLVGLDQLRILGAKPILNFAFVSRSKRVYAVLRAYFDLLMSYGELSTVRSKDEYIAITRPAELPAGVQPAIDELLNVAETEASVLHVLLLGSVAKCVSGLVPTPFSREHEADLDVIVVYATDDRSAPQRIRDKITEALAPARYGIVWGPDEQFFYEWRVKDKVNVDVELLPEGSPFLANNRLLGTSITRYFTLLYSLGSRSLCESLDLPQVPMAAKERWRVLLQDRKGLYEFRTRLSADPQGVDPRRVLSLVVRNVAWAITGQHPVNSDAALAALIASRQSLFFGNRIEQVTGFLACNHDDSVLNRGELIQEAKLFTEHAIQLAEEQLRMP